MSGIKASGVKSVDAPRIQSVGVYGIEVVAKCPLLFPPFGRCARGTRKWGSEVSTLCTNYKFKGQVQRRSPVADARGIARIIMLLLCRAAAPTLGKICKQLLHYIGTGHEDGCCNFDGNVISPTRLEHSALTSSWPVPISSVEGYEPCRSD